MNTVESGISTDVVIDGAQGEGGGQVFRTSLSLAMCLGKSVRIENIRAGRAKPGLLRQHLTCLRAAQTICNAKVIGDDLGSTEVVFVPGTVKAGEYHFQIGSAGSTTLVFQTVLLPLLLADEVSELYLEGGTHNGMSPSYDFIVECFLPVLQSLGCRVETSLEQVGFYPAGGGAWRARIYPMNAASGIDKVDLVTRGGQQAELAMAMSSKIPEHVTQRELTHIQQRCRWSESVLRQRLVKSSGPGNIVSLQVNMGNITEVFECVGERNLSAEKVASRAITQMNRYLRAGVPVGEYLADQLLLPMVLGSGGKFRTLNPSMHLLTNIDVIRMMSRKSITAEKIEEDCWEISVTGNSE
ncbi:RNA 3'-terminal-phosphate cyclase [Gammaproteobacteria bacterium 45_16_T64]|nr:RNA 3'-terminal-phosphate cyclase [Gammaproteobacteria bacterium 45_16_T64]